MNIKCWIWWLFEWEGGTNMSGRPSLRLCCCHHLIIVHWITTHHIKNYMSIINAFLLTVILRLQLKRRLLLHFFAWFPVFIGTNPLTLALFHLRSWGGRIRFCQPSFPYFLTFLKRSTTSNCAFLLMIIVPCRSVNPLNRHRILVMWRFVRKVQKMKGDVQVSRENCQGLNGTNWYLILTVLSSLRIFTR